MRTRAFWLTFSRVRLRWLRRALGVAALVPLAGCWPWPRGPYLRPQYPDAHARIGSRLCGGYGPGPSEMIRIPAPGGAELSVLARVLDDHVGGTIVLRAPRHVRVGFTTDTILVPELVLRGAAPELNPPVVLESVYLVEKHPGQGLRVLTDSTAVPTTRIFEGGADYGSLLSIRFRLPLRERDARLVSFVLQLPPVTAADTIMTPRPITFLYRTGEWGTYGLVLNC